MPVSEKKPYRVKGLDLNFLHLIFGHFGRSKEFVQLGESSGTAGCECGCVSVYVCAGCLCAWASVRMSMCMCMCMGVCVHVHEHEHDHDHEQLTKARGALSDPHMRCAFTHARGARARALTQILAADGKQCCG